MLRMTHGKVRCTSIRVILSEVEESHYKKSMIIKNATETQKFVFL